MADYNRIIALARSLGCAVAEHEPMSMHTTFRVGGPCDVLITPATRDALTAVISMCDAEGVNIFILGNGSNVVFGDAGFRGVVVSTAGLSCITVDGDAVICDAGVRLTAMCNAALAASLGGAEKLYGIPGTVGGAVCMNAGAYGGEIADIIESCDYFDGERVVTVSADRLGLGYRHSIFSDGGKTVLSARFRLHREDADKIRSEMDLLMQRRRDKQPLDYPSAGSVFKRPEGHFAGALIEQSGLKGITFGGAQVSTKHAGFIVNAGSATAADIKELVRLIQETVLNNTGVKLECEIRFVGD